MSPSLPSVSSDIAPIVDSPSKIQQPASKDVTTEKDYWNTFYSRFNVSIPSTWCVTTAIESDLSIPIVEFGCGNGRDAIYLATHGFTVYGCDLSKEAIKHNNEKSANLEQLEFCLADVSIEEQVASVMKKARSSKEGKGTQNVLVYTRFFLHSIDQRQQDLFFAALSSSCILGDKLYFEFRCSMDEALDKVHGKEHYRRYVDTPALMGDLEKGGFVVEYEVTGRGMAKYKQEDPYVSRIIARKV
eukprot:CAMPEP_0181112488 /NCGR_PEP_ID=MMETSP1071-20121207/19842_1 /TAXON_ID=35127 /ORGANISM="Thalassiosira sp., Strain NH16" /LENGTH=243 /DNA_ID=CAMNT_0023196465 /DNA_START=128 /DNA_END=859 /DNA_ORIENTATION=-